MGVLTYRSVAISGSNPDICIDLIEGFLIPPDVRGSDWIVPRLDGRVEGNRRKDVLILPLAGIVKGSGATPDERREDFLANIETLMAAMDPSLASADLVLSDGYLGLEAGVTATIGARVRNASPAAIQAYHFAPHQRWTFELECLTPEWTYGT